MNDKANLLWFLNSQKEELNFNDAHDFKNKIASDFNFRFKIQKFVFLAKYFGWDNEYKFALYPRGPYSSVLAEDYYSNISNSMSLDISNFKKDSFEEFIHGKSEYDLEAASTILYYKGFNQTFSLNDAILTLNKIKPHITSDIVKKAYYDVDNLSIIKDITSNSVSNDFLKNFKSGLLNKIVKLIAQTEKINFSNNSKHIILSLNYLKNILINETLDNNPKNDLLSFISRYVAKIEELFILSRKDGEILKNMDIAGIKELFSKLEDYIKWELDFSGLNETKGLGVFEEYYLIKKFILEEIISKYKNLATCDLYFEDEIGNSAFEYYIRTHVYLSYDIRKELLHDIITKVYEFCINLDLEDIFKTISIFLVNP